MFPGRDYLSPTSAMAKIGCTSERTIMRQPLARKCCPWTWMQLVNKGMIQVFRPSCSLLVVCAQSRLELASAPAYPTQCNCTRCKKNFKHLLLVLCTTQYPVLGSLKAAAAAGMKHRTQNISKCKSCEAVRQTPEKGSKMHAPGFMTLSAPA